MTELPDPLDLRGRRVLITGASSGIGAATAEAFAERGAIVGICARRTAGLDTTATACSGAAAVHQWTVDLADLDNIDAFAQQAAADMGGIDILVNNAGAGRRTKMQSISIADFDETMAINFSAAMRLTLAVLPQMLERDHGHIVTVGSSGTREFAPSTGSYIAAKSALQAFAEALYIDLAPTNVHSRLVVPGRTATEFGADKPGQDPPFPADPAATDTPAVVAETIVACLTSPDFESYPSERVQTAIRQKCSDPNEYLRTRREWFRRR